MQIEEFIGNAQGFNSGNVGYVPVGNNWMTFNTVQSSAQVPRDTPGTFSKLSVFIDNYTSSVASVSSTINFQVNGVNGNQSVSWNSRTTGKFTDASGTDTINSGDLLNLKITIGTIVSGGIEIGVMSTVFTAAGTISATRLIAKNSGFFFTQGTTVAVVPGGGIADNTLTTSQATWTCKSNGATFTDLYVIVDSNSVTASSTVTSLVNGSVGNQTISIPGTTTGSFHDTTNSDTLNIGDTFCYQAVIGAGGTSLSTVIVSSEFITNDGTWVVGCGGTTSTGVISNSFPYFTLTGRCLGSNVVVTVPSTYLGLRNCEFVITTNTSSANLAVRLVQNYSFQSFYGVSIPPTTTGRFTDTTDTVSVAAGDALYWQTTGRINSIAMTACKTDVFFMSQDINMFDLTPGTAICWKYLK